MIKSATFSSCHSSLSLAFACTIIVRTSVEIASLTSHLPHLTVTILQPTTHLQLTYCWLISLPSPTPCPWPSKSSSSAFGQCLGTFYRHTHLTSSASSSVCSSPRSSPAPKSRRRGPASNPPSERGLAPPPPPSGRRGSASSTASERGRPPLPPHWERKRRYQ